MVVKKLMKKTWYPRIHNSIMSFQQDLTIANTQYVTCPLMMYDEGLGAASAFDSNPSNASFVVTGMPNCFPESRIEKIRCNVEVSLTKPAIETDKLHRVKVGIMPIFTSFLEDLTPKDELTGATIKTILELASETTDRQAYPLWNGTKLPEKFSGSATLDAAVPGLTTNQIIEAVSFDPETYYDALHYFTNGNKLKSVQGGIKWFNLTRNHPFVNMQINLRSTNKFMNEYSQFSVMILVPNADTHYQVPVDTDVTNVDHVSTSIVTRYNEWNEQFNTERV